MTSNKLIKKLTNDVNRLQNKIEHRNLYNIRNFVIKVLLKNGIAFDYALPFILAAIIIANSHASKGDAPFRIDEKTVKADVETIDTSSGIHLEHISYDFSYDDELIEHSTGWIMNDQGLYERTVTSYRLDDEINLEDTEKIMSMTKEEVDQALVITNVRTIKKKTLTPEDSIYHSDAIIVINHFISEEETFTRLETTGENIEHSIWYIISVLCLGGGFTIIKKIFVRTYIRDYIRDRLREYEPLLRQVNKEELETMRKILKVKQENLAMIDGETRSLDEKEGYPYHLRKV